MNYSNKTIAELKIICKERRIKGITRKNKQGLIELIQQNENVIQVSELPINNPPTATEDVLSVNYWKNINSFKTIKDRETQIKFYKRMNSCEEVLQLVILDSKPFGQESEKIIKEIFGILPRTSPQNDGIKNGKKIEIKSARYWEGKDECKWQHLEPEHDYEYILFTLLDFQGWKVWGIKKTFLMGELRDRKIVTFQGKQGWWVKKSAIIPYLTPINNIGELDIFIQS